MPRVHHAEFQERAGMDLSSLPDWAWLDVAVVQQAQCGLHRGKPVSLTGRQ